jgi:hypothetical protein
MRHLGRMSSRAYEGPGIRSSRCDPTPAPPTATGPFLSADPAPGNACKDRAASSLASEPSALAEDDRIEFMPVADGIRKGAGLAPTTMRRGRGRSRWGGRLAHPHRRLRAAPRAPWRRGDGESPSRLRARSGVGGAAGSEEGMTSRAAPLRPGGQRSGLSKAGGQDDVREEPHKVHVFSRCPNGSARR